MVDWLNGTFLYVPLSVSCVFDGFRCIFVSQVLLTATVQTFHGEIFGLPLHWAVSGAWHICGQTIAAAGAQIVFHIHGVNPRATRTENQDESSPRTFSWKYLQGLLWVQSNYRLILMDWWRGKAWFACLLALLLLIDSKQTGYPGCPRPGFMSPMQSTQVGTFWIHGVVETDARLLTFSDFKWTNSF